MIGSLLARLADGDQPVPARVEAFRRVSMRLLLIEQWVLLVPIAVAAYLSENSWVGVLVIGAIFHATTTAVRLADPIGFSTRSLIATGMLLDVLLLIYALTGTGSWQMDGGHMWVFAVWSHCLALLCWRSLVISGALGVLHHFFLIYLLPLWVFPDGANLWRVFLHGGVVVMQLSVLCVFVFFIIRMLTNAEELEAALADSLAKVEEVSRSKSQFLAHMSHELRTPLNAIIGFSELTKDQTFGPLPERYRGYASDIHASGGHLLALINDVLDLSRVESGKHELFEEVVDLQVLVKACVAMTAVRARNAGVRIEVAIAAPICFTADERAVKQVLLNLLTNAIKYTGAGGNVAVTAENHPGGLDLSVSDNGCGIPSTMMAKIFEPFQRADSMVTREVEGSGLGLAISRHFMEMHGGRLILESRVGAGTVATARFPAGRVVSGSPPDAAGSLCGVAAGPGVVAAEASGTLFAASD